MLSGTLFYPVRFTWADARTYFFVGLFAAGNLFLPQFCHMIPSGGRMFLPIYFFTLVASYKFGLKVGLTTAVLSPLLNSFLFAMPPVAALPAILVKSVLLALIANYVAFHSKKLSLFHLAFVVLGYQIAGSAIEWMISQDFRAATADLTIGIWGMIIQVCGGWWVLKKLALYEQ
ncbi:MAG TPA: hypothetical protein VFP87_01630 [Chitinophagaceae bacterium]|nr:hypothetical protein [Chitinophagaceae bacterium]